MPELNRSVPPQEFEPPPSDEMKAAFDKAVEEHAKGSQKAGETPLADKDWGAEYDKAVEEMPDIVLTDEQILAEQAKKYGPKTAARRELQQSPEMLALYAKMNDLRSRIDAVKGTEGINYKGGERAKKQELEFLNEQVGRMQDKILEQSRIDQADRSVDRALELGAEDTEKAMSAFAINEMIQEELDKAAKEKTELAEKLAKLNARQAEFSNDIAGIAADLQKAVDGKSYAAVGVYAKSLNQINKELSKIQKEAAAAQSELGALVDQPLENLQNSIELSAPATKEEAPEEITPDMIEEMTDMQPAEKEEAIMLVEKNELAPERKALIQIDLAKWDNEIHAIREGIELVDAETGKTIDKPGLKELEARLKNDYGIDVYAVVDAKSDDEAVAASKKSRSKKTWFMNGLRSIFNPGYRKTMDQYKERVKELRDVEDRIDHAKLELRDPKKYAQLVGNEHMRVLGVAAKLSSSSKSGSALDRKS